ncbi:MAG: hypothetical protein KJP23_00490 [Deltaproteobacteria bacterium]|nr:hypothetical protein [Deltaproteobacteria bacterium]
MSLKKISFILFILLLFVSSSIAGTVYYRYDQLGRLTRAKYSDGSVIEYIYDAVGNRLSMKVTAGVDSDGDGLPDSLEDSYCTLTLDADSDDDGILDGAEDANHNGALDSGETDPCDLDTDGDGIQDGTELGYTLGHVGSDTDKGVFQPDLDPTTTTDPLDADTDGDGWQDGVEDANLNGRIDSEETDPNLFNPRAMPWLPLLLLSDPEAQLKVWYEPNPVPVYTGDNPCYTGTEPEWHYTVYVAETGGVEILIDRFTAGFYDGTGSLINENEYNSSDFADRFDDCGEESAYIAAQSEACARLCARLGGRNSGSVVYGFSGTDDYGNSVSKSARVYFSAP